MNTALAFPLYWILNGMDLAFTLKLHFDDRLVELNPLASGCLATHGPLWLVLYKLAITLFVTAICIVLRTRRPISARRTLRISNCIVSGVVFYSAALMAFAS
jgi:hypothetical protein